MKWVRFINGRFFCQKWYTMYKTIRFWTALGVYLYKALFSAGVKRFLSEIAIFSKILTWAREKIIRFSPCLAKLKLTSASSVLFRKKKEKKTCDPNVSTRRGAGFKGHPAIMRRFSFPDCRCIRGILISSVFL